MEEKINRLNKWLKDKGQIAVAFSGGVDSSFLLIQAKEVLGDQVLAMTADAPAFPRREMAEAAELCGMLGVRQLKLELSLDEIDGFVDNPTDRCYHCKKSIFSKVVQRAAQEGFYVVADGTNADDVQDYRPGIKALKEMNIESPLLEAGLTKNEIRSALKAKGYAMGDKPAAACLASRIPYGESITAEKLFRIEQAEEALKLLGFTQVRVRHRGETGWVEVDPVELSKFQNGELREKTLAAVKQAGFADCMIDPDGYKTGKLNINLKD